LRWLIVEFSKNVHTNSRRHASLKGKKVPANKARCVEEFVSRLIQFYQKLCRNEKTSKNICNKIMWLNTTSSQKTLLSV
jgi:hypothetical protein